MPPAGTVQPGGPSEIGPKNFLLDFVLSDRPTLTSSTVIFRDGYPDAAGSPSTKVTCLSARGPSASLVGYGFRESPSFFFFSFSSSLVGSYFVVPLRHYFSSNPRVHELPGRSTRADGKNNRQSLQLRYCLLAMPVTRASSFLYERQCGCLLLTPLRCDDEQGRGRTGQQQ